MRRKTIGKDILNQLDESPIDLLTAPTVKNGTPVLKQKVEVPTKPIQKKKTQNMLSDENIAIKSNRQKGIAKERITVQISKDTIERVKDCVYWNRLTVAQFVEEALEVALREAEKENGKPFQKRRSELRPGRPTK